MEQNIRQYEAENKTGNPVLDTLLTAKSMYCQQHGITLPAWQTVRRWIYGYDGPVFTVRQCAGQRHRECRKSCPTASSD